MVSANIRWYDLVDKPQAASVIRGAAPAGALACNRLQMRLVHIQGLPAQGAKSIRRFEAMALMPIWLFCFCFFGGKKMRLQVQGAEGGSPAVEPSARPGRDPKHEKAGAPLPPQQPASIADRPLPSAPQKMWHQGVHFRVLKSLPPRVRAARENDLATAVGTALTTVLFILRHQDFCP